MLYENYGFNIYIEALLLIYYGLRSLDSMIPFYVIPNLSKNVKKIALT